MRIFFCQVMYTYIEDSVIYYMKRYGHEVISKYYNTPENLCRDDKLTEQIAGDIKKGNYDCVFSVNYQPVIAYACDQCKKTYLAWSYDSPIDVADKSSMNLPTNRIFLYDRVECEKLIGKGYNNIFYLPLAADMRMHEKCSGVVQDKDITFVGKLYESTYPVLRSGMSEYVKGHLDALIEAQKNLYGAYILPNLVDEKLIERINSDYRESMDNPITITDEQLCFSMATQVTYMDRIALLRIMTHVGDVHLYTFGLNEENESILTGGGVHIHGKVDYLTEMPRVFASSRINLHPCLRAIASGISLRVLDVISCGGFLLSSFQPEILDYFVPGEEIVYYESYEDAYEKARFYLNHENERVRIIENGIERLRTDFTYEDRIRRILDTV